MRNRLFAVLEQTGGMSIPLQPDRGNQQNLRSPDRGKAADFPEEIKRRPGGRQTHQ
jgi:N-acetylglucosamine-6-sulfatase